MLVIEYCKDGGDVSDFEILEWLEDTEGQARIFKEACDSDRDYCFTTNNSLFVTFVRLLVAKQMLDCTKVKFMIDEEECKVDRIGQFVNTYPKSKAFDIETIMLRELVIARRNE